MALPGTPDRRYGLQARTIHLHQPLLEQHIEPGRVGIDLGSRTTKIVVWTGKAVGHADVFDTTPDPLPGIREKLAHLREMDRRARAAEQTEAPSEAGAGAPVRGTP